MTVHETNIVYAVFERLLFIHGFNNVKRWVEHKPAYTILALEVYCSPLLMKDKVAEIKKIVPGSWSVTPNTNQSYILIKQQ